MPSSPNSPDLWVKMEKNQKKIVGKQPLRTSSDCIISDLLFAGSLVDLVLNLLFFILRPISTS
jgi:hypothetical protein